MTGEFGGWRSGVFWCPGSESWALRFRPVGPCGFGLFLAVVSLDLGQVCSGWGGACSSALGSRSCLPVSRW